MKIARSPRPCFLYRVYFASADALLRYAFCRAVHSPVKLLKPLFRLVCFFRFAFRVAADRPSGKKFGGVRIRGKGNFFLKRDTPLFRRAHTEDISSNRDVPKVFRLLSDRDEISNRKDNRGLTDAASLRIYRADRFSFSHFLLSYRRFGRFRNL